MSVSLAKLKVVAPETIPEGDRGPEAEASVDDILASVMEEAHSDQALMMWHTTDWAAVQLGIARPGQRPSQQEVRRSTLRALLAGRHPVSGETIGRVGRDGTRVAALGVSVAAPRSVSILWGMGEGDLPDELKVMVAQAADRAVMRMLREQPLVRRRGKDGEIEHVRARDYMAVSALHTTGTARGREVPDPPPCTCATC